MNLVIFKEVRATLPTSRMKRLFNVLARRECGVRASGQVNLIICSDSRLRRLNRRFRGVDRVTDVLSFQLDRSGDADQVLGEIYISAPRAVRQSREHGRGVYSEYLLLFCHGLLHLFGHDHDTPRKERAMFGLQSRYLNTLPSRGR